MQFYKKQLNFLLAFTFLLSACSGNAEATADPNVILTSSIGTMVASFFETQTAMVTPATFTPTATETKFPTPTEFVAQSPLNSLTPTILFYTATAGSPTVTGTLPTATVNSSALGNGCYNLSFVRDVNYPNGTVVKPGQNFTKTWKVENNGTCDWLYVYRFVFVSGDNFDPAWGNLGKVVKPGTWAELSINFDAPNKPGTYSAYWRFSDGGAKVFGATLGVTIKVEADPTVTNVPTNTNTATPTVVPSNTPIPSETPIPIST